MSTKRKTLSLPVKQTHDPRFGIFVATLIAGIERRYKTCPSIATLALMNALEEAREAAFGPAD